MGGVNILNIKITELVEYEDGVAELIKLADSLGLPLDEIQNPESEYLPTLLKIELDKYNINYQSLNNYKSLKLGREPYNKIDSTPLLPRYEMVYELIELDWNKPLQDKVEGITPSDVDVNIDKLKNTFLMYDLVEDYQLISLILQYPDVFKCPLIRRDYNLTQSDPEGYINKAVLELYIDGYDYHTLKQVQEYLLTIPTDELRAHIKLIQDESKSGRIKISIDDKNAMNYTKKKKIINMYTYSGIDIRLVPEFNKIEELIDDEKRYFRELSNQFRPNSKRQDNNVELINNR